MGFTHHERCFGCGRSNPFGLRLDVEPHDGGVRGGFTVASDHQGPPGFAHGGIVATALDEAMSLAVHARGLFALTSSFEVELRAPVPVGEPVAIEARLEREDARTIEMTASLTAPGGMRPYATARGAFVRVDPPHGG